jgi:hypothetical protein
LLSSTRALRVVVVPSLRVTSPPKPSRVMVSPTAGLGASALGASDEPLVLAAGSAAFSLTFSLVSLALGAALVALVGFLLGAAGGGGALRLRSSMTMMGDG